MKKMLFTAAMLMLSSVSFAQFSNSSSSSSSEVSTDGWSTIWVEYNPMKVKFDVSGVDDKSLTGFSAGYSQAFGLSQNTPIFLEAGIGVQYANYSDSERINFEGYGKVNVDQDITIWAAKVPVNFLYCYSIPNSSIKIAPFAGVTLRYNISGTLKYEAEGESVKYDLFKKSDMEEIDFLDGKEWKRFQIGWQIGLKARFGQSFMAGVSYGSDFSEIAYKSKIQTTSITIGYTF